MLFAVTFIPELELCGVDKPTDGDFVITVEWVLCIVDTAVTGVDELELGVLSDDETCAKNVTMVVEGVLFKDEFVINAGADGVVMTLTEDINFEEYVVLSMDFVVVVDGIKSFDVVPFVDRVMDIDGIVDRDELFVAVLSRRMVVRDDCLE